MKKKFSRWKVVKFCHQDFAQTYRTGTAVGVVELFMHLSSAAQQRKVTDGHGAAAAPQSCLTPT